MSQALKNLLDLLDLEKIEEGIYRGQSEDLGLRQVLVVRSSDKHYMLQSKPYLWNEIFTLSTAISYVLVIVANPLFTM